MLWVQMAQLAAAMLDRQADAEEAVRRAWAPAVQPLALHLVCGAAGLGDERLVPPALQLRYAVHDSMYLSQI